MNIYEAIKSLVAYAVREQLIEKADEIWAVNRILEILSMDSIPADVTINESAELEEMLRY